MTDVEAAKLIEYLDSTLVTFHALSGHLESEKQENRVSGAMVALSALRSLVITGALSKDAPPLQGVNPLWNAQSADGS